jgi:hypothetical protein
MLLCCYLALKISITTKITTIFWLLLIVLMSCKKCNDRIHEGRYRVADFLAGENYFDSAANYPWSESTWTTISKCVKNTAWYTLLYYVQLNLVHVKCKGSFTYDMRSVPDRVRMSPSDLEIFKVKIFNFKGVLRGTPSKIVEVPIVNRQKITSITKLWFSFPCWSASTSLFGELNYLGSGTLNSDQNLPTSFSLSSTGEETSTKKSSRAWTLFFVGWRYILTQKLIFSIGEKETMLLKMTA